MKSRHPLRFRARAEILLNGHRVTIRGSGPIHVRSGRINGRYHIQGDLGNVDPRIFKTVLVTGYPSVCSHKPDLCSPFEYTDYQYSRYIDFGVGSRISYQAECELVECSDGLILDSLFSGIGEVPPGKLEDALDVSEEWVCMDQGVMGNFEIEFPRAEGKPPLVGRAQTEYQPRSSSIVPGRRYDRRITFPSFKCDNTSFELIQNSALKLA